MNGIPKKNCTPGLERGFFFVRKGNLGVIDVGSLIYGLLILSSVYATYIFAPLVWKKQELKSLFKEVSYQMKNMPEDVAKERVIEVSKRETGAILDPKNVTIVISEDKILIKALWKPEVELINGRTYAFPMEVVQSTTIFR